MSFAASYLAMVSDSPGRYHFLVQKATGAWFVSGEAARFLGLPKGCDGREAGTFFREKLRSSSAGPARAQALRLLDGDKEDNAPLPLWLQTGAGRERLAFFFLETLTDPDTGEQYLAGCLFPSPAELPYEPVTGLPGRAKLLSDLAARRQQGPLPALLLLQITNLSELTSCYPSAFVTDLLHQFAAFLLHDSQTRKLSCYCLGSGRFVLLGAALCPQDLADCFAGLRARFLRGIPRGTAAAYPELGGAGLPAGEAFWPGEALLRTLERTLLRRGAGRDFVLLEKDEAERERERQVLLRSLRRDIRAGCRGFRVVFQPIVEAGTGKVTAAEALTRWHSKRFGEVSPGRFIPLLEGSPAFLELARWIRETALTQAVSLNLAYPGIRLHLNVSDAELVREDFAEVLTSCAARTGFPKDQICLELTERCRLLDPDALSRILVPCRKAGMTVAIDDFGTGFSSLSLLRKIPVDVIKIDRTFILDIEKSRRDREMIRSIVQLASGFGGKVVIEGVETNAVRELLLSLGADAFQGYLFGRPCPAGELAQKGRAGKICGCHPGPFA